VVVVADDGVVVDGMDEGDELVVVAASSPPQAETTNAVAMSIAIQVRTARR
jgi:hypothetical protein